MHPPPSGHSLAPARRKEVRLHPRPCGRRRQDRLQRRLLAGGLRSASPRSSPSDRSKSERRPRRRLMKRVAPTLVLAVSLLLVSAVPASAVKPLRQLLPPNEDFVVEGVCDFPVLLHDVRGKVSLKTFFDQ